MAAHWQDAVDLEAHSPPFDRNTSAWTQRVPVAILAAIGALLAAYMALFQLELTATVWDPIFGDGSAKVLTSDTAETMDRWLHVPDAGFGAWAYLSEAVFSLVGGTRRWQHRPWMVIIFGIDVIPLGGIGAILVILQGLVVGSWCFLCLVTAAISIALIFFAYDEVWASLVYLRKFWRETKSPRRWLRVFWGLADPDADRIALSRSD